MFRPAPAAALRGLAWVALGLILWMTLASIALLWLTDGFAEPRIASWQRPFQWLVHVRAFGADIGNSACVVIAALFATTPFVVIGRLVLARTGRAISPPFCPSPRDNAWQ